MHIKHSTFYWILSASCILLMASSCKKFVQIEPSPDLIRTENIFQTDNTAIAAASQVYVEMNISAQRISYMGMSFFGAFSADEIHSTFSDDVYDAFTNSALSSKDLTLKGSFWNASYKNIYNTNSVIQGLSNSSTMSSPVKNQLTGEMKMVRAWYYFYLINLFGDVPLITVTDYKLNSAIPRTPVAEVYQQIIKDLTDAQSLLTDDYPSDGKVRPNKFVATALLSRVYLYREDWSNAELQASAIINSNKYALVGDLNKVFLLNSSETIWETAPIDNVGNNPIARRFIPNSSSTIPPFVLNNSLVNSFETNDLRKENWVGKNEAPGTPPADYYYAYKYKEKLINPVKEYNTVLRLDEQYLIRAEARTQQNKITEAQNDLNMIRNRAGLLNTTAGTQPDLLLAIEHERRVELFTEWAHRWFDLKRTGRIDVVLGAEKGANWQTTDALYPIPYDELLYNPLLIQNPGY